MGPFWSLELELQILRSKGNDFHKFSTLLKDVLHLSLRTTKTDKARKGSGTAHVVPKNFQEPNCRLRRGIDNRLFLNFVTPIDNRGAFGFLLLVDSEIAI